MRTHGRTPSRPLRRPHGVSQPATAGAHPPDLPRGVARDECVGRNVVGRDGPRADRREPSHIIAGYDDRAGADRCPFLAIGLTAQSSIRALALAVMERGYRSFVRMAFGPMNTRPRGSRRGTRAPRSGS